MPRGRASEDGRDILCKICNKDMGVVFESDGVSVCQTQKLSEHLYMSFGWVVAIPDLAVNIRLVAAWMISQSCPGMAFPGVWRSWDQGTSKGVRSQHALNRSKTFFVVRRESV